MLRTSLPLALAAALAAGCGDNQAAPPFPAHDCSQVTSGSCVEIVGGDSATLQTQTNSIGANTTIILGVGTFKLTNQVTIRTAGAHLIGQGIDTTTLDFGMTDLQPNGVEVHVTNLLIQALMVGNG